MIRHDRRHGSGVQGPHPPHGVSTASRPAPDAAIAAVRLGLSPARAAAGAIRWVHAASQQRHNRRWRPRHHDVWPPPPLAAGKDARYGRQSLRCPHSRPDRGGTLSSPAADRRGGRRFGCTCHDVRARRDRSDSFRLSSRRSALQPEWPVLLEPVPEQQVPGAQRGELYRRQGLLRDGNQQLRWRLLRLLPDHGRGQLLLICWGAMLGLHHGCPVLQGARRPRTRVR
jgi:hypothetical protein